MSGIIAIDLARLRRVQDHARAAGRVALAVGKSAGRFAGACAVIAGGSFAAWHCLGDVRQPDAVLLHRAVEQARAAAAAAAFDLAHPSAVAARNQALGLLAGAALVAAGGVVGLVEWWQSLPFVRKPPQRWHWEPLDPDAE